MNFYAYLLHVQYHECNTIGMILYYMQCHVCMVSDLNCYHGLAISIIAKWY